MTLLSHSKANKERLDRHLAAKALNPLFKDRDSLEVQLVDPTRFERIAPTPDLQAINQPMPLYFPISLSIL